MFESKVDAELLAEQQTRFAVHAISSLFLYIYIYQGMLNASPMDVEKSKRL